MRVVEINVRMRGEARDEIARAARLRSAKTPRVIEGLGDGLKIGLVCCARENHQFLIIAQTAMVK